MPAIAFATLRSSAIAFAVVLAGSTLGCVEQREVRRNETSPIEDGQPMTILTEWHGSQSEREEPDFQVIRDQRAWEQAWDALPTDDSVPEVDFDQQLVLAAWMGQRMTGGYAIRIRDIRPTADGEAFEAILEHREPGPDEFVTQALTAPYHIVVIPRTDKEIRPRVVE
ncbi:MAG: protease complex subunit PrcB family protein [Phycisphaeraceae bacterium]